MKDIYRNAKATFCLFYEMCHKEGGKRHWAKRIAFCDKKLKQSRGSGILELMRRVKVWVIVVNIAVLLSIFTSGCQTAKGVMGDTGWFLTRMSDNINTEQEK